MTLSEAVDSWLENEAAIRKLAGDVGGDFLELVEDLYTTITAPASRRSAKIEATRRLLELTRSSLANINTRGPRPHTPADDWDWGVPGSTEDLELLELAP